ncbi:MAG: hypothetical protein IKZ25_04560 [Clostridia bacterium]|nr:hypothetical protein [Clostridia bacterium]
MIKLSKKDYIIGLGVLFLTAIIYALLFVLYEIDGMFITSFVFALLSEVIFFLSSFMIKESKIKSLASLIAGLNLVFSVSVSIFLFYKNINPILALIIDIFWFLGTYGFCGYVIYRDNKEDFLKARDKKRQEKIIEEEKKAVATSDGRCEKILYDYMVDLNTNLYKKKINGIYEEVSKESFRNLSEEKKEEILSLVIKLDTLLRKEDESAIEIIEEIMNKLG